MKAKYVDCATCRQSFRAVYGERICGRCADTEETY